MVAKLERVPRITNNATKQRHNRPRATKGFAIPRGNFVDYVFLKATCLQHVCHLVVGAFRYYSVLKTLPQYKITAVKVILELFKSAKQSCNI